MRERWLVFVIGFLAASLLPAVLWAQPCESLSKFASPAVNITLTKSIASGDLVIAGNWKGFSKHPAFCRVAANLKPTPDSDIGIEVWLPLSGWNGKFLAVGSGGWGGSIAYDAMADALRRGYATSATDDGHTGRGASFIAGHPEKFIDF